MKIHLNLQENRITGFGILEDSEYLSEKFYILEKQFVLTNNIHNKEFINNLIFKIIHIKILKLILY